MWSCCYQSAHVFISRYDSALLGRIFFTLKVFLDEIYFTGKKVKFPGLINHRKCQGNLEWNFLDKSCCNLVLRKCHLAGHFLNLWKFHISCTFPGQGNMTFPAHFHWCRKFHISCTIPSKDTWNFLYISCSVRNFMCPAHFQDQGHWHLLYISYTYLAVSEILHFMHIYKTRTHDISCTFPVISEILCVGYISIVKDMWHLLYISLVHNSNLQWNVTL